MDRDQFWLDEGSSRGLRRIFRSIPAANEGSMTAA
jgi:hypothetical protein